MEFLWVLFAPLFLDDSLVDRLYVMLNLGGSCSTLVILLMCCMFCLVSSSLMLSSPLPPFLSLTCVWGLVYQWQWCSSCLIMLYCFVFCIQFYGDVWWHIKICTWWTLWVLFHVYCECHMFCSMCIVSIICSVLCSFKRLTLVYMDMCTCTDRQRRGANWYFGVTPVCFV